MKAVFIFIFAFAVCMAAQVETQLKASSSTEQVAQERHSDIMATAGAAAFV